MHWPWDIFPTFDEAVGERFWSTWSKALTGCGCDGFAQGRALAFERLGLLGFGEVSTDLEQPLFRLKALTTRRGPMPRSADGRLFLLKFEGVLVSGSDTGRGVDARDT